MGTALRCSISIGMIFIAHGHCDWYRIVTGADIHVALFPWPSGLLLVCSEYPSVWFHNCLPNYIFILHHWKKSHINLYNASICYNKRINREQIDVKHFYRGIIRYAPMRLHPHPIPPLLSSHTRHQQHDQIAHEPFMKCLYANILKII